MAVNQQICGTTAIVNMTLTHTELTAACRCRIRRNWAEKVL